MIDEEAVRQIRELREKGKGVSFIGRALGLSRPTVRKFLEQEYHSDPVVIKPHSENTHPFIQKKKEGSSGMSAESRNEVGACLDALQALNMLKAVTFRFFSFLKNYPWILSQSGSEFEIFSAIHETLSNLYKKFQKSSQFSDLDLREAFDSILEARRLWNECIVEGDEENLPEADDGFCRSKTDLEKDLACFDTVLESIKTLLMLKK